MNLDDDDIGATGGRGRELEASSCVDPWKGWQSSRGLPAKHCPLAREADKCWGGAPNTVDADLCRNVGNFLAVGDL